MPLGSKDMYFVDGNGTGNDLAFFLSIDNPSKSRCFTWRLSQINNKNGYRAQTPLLAVQQLTPNLLHQGRESRHADPVSPRDCAPPQNGPGLLSALPEHFHLDLRRPRTPVDHLML